MLGSNRTPMDIEGKKSLVLIGLNFFPENLSAVSDKQGERIHQDIQAMEVCYQGIGNEEMIGDNYWMLYLNDPSHVYKRKLHAKDFLSAMLHSCVLFLMLFSENTNSTIF